MHRLPPYSLDRDVLAREIEIDTFRASGPGGQNLHKTESAVRLRHLPSGVVLISSDTRSQTRNREIALERLIERLRKLNVVPKKRKKTRPSLGAKKRRLEGKRQASGDQADAWAGAGGVMRLTAQRGDAEAQRKTRPECPKYEVTSASLRSSAVEFLLTAITVRTRDQNRTGRGES
ncbi:MAG: peptide chain release factor-like protein [Comamonadaceae bacterium]|nr:peptide chain release factor-like protein [Comamonadaceae bacterium]